MTSVTFVYINTVFPFALVFVAKFYARLKNQFCYNATKEKPTKLDPV